MNKELERCETYDELTGNAGIEEDSIVCDLCGRVVCDNCYVDSEMILCTMCEADL